MNEPGMNTARIVERLFERIDDIVEASGKTNAELAKLNAKMVEQGDDTKRLMDAVEGNGSPGLKQRMTTLESYWKVVAWALAPLYAAAITFLIDHFSK